tara:strand:+ start:159 stop:965 length:807 start_codon:yes stop_codon:yes gene_type:complete
MRKIMNEWRGFLTDDIAHVTTLKHKYFGPNPERLRCVQMLRREAERDQRDYPDGWHYMECLEKAGFKRLGSGNKGEGSWRMAYIIPGVENAILKFAYEPRQGRDMNKAEAEGAYQTKFQDVVPRVYESAPDYMWIKVQKANIILSSSDMLKFFPGVEKAMRSGSVNVNEARYVISQAFRVIGESIKENVKPQDTSEWMWLLEGDNWEFEEEEGMMIIKDPLVNRLAQLQTEFKAETWDVRPGNVGYVVERDGSKRFVLIDPGIGIGRR